MSDIIISYNRQNEAVVRTLAKDIGALGHTVWFDQELGGGQAWWDQILGQVRACDVFVFALSPEALDSTACDREYHYADDLGKLILPILVAEGVRINLLPPALAKIQFVDYRKHDDRGTAFRLARAINTVPPPKPLPDPLPDPPEVPVSYLGSLAEQVGTTPDLSREEQSTLVLKLKRALSETENADDARTLLTSLRKRDDLLAIIAEEVDELLTGASKAPSPPPTPEPAEPNAQFAEETEAVADTAEQVAQKTTKIEPESVAQAVAEEAHPPRTQILQHPHTRHPQNTTSRYPTLPDQLQKISERVKGAMYLAGGGVVLGAIFAFFTDDVNDFLPGLLIAGGFFGAIAGVISRTDRERLRGALILTVIGVVWALIFAKWHDAALYTAHNIGAETRLVKIVLQEAYSSGLDRSDYAMLSFIGGMTGMIAGAISGTDWRVIVASIVGMVIALPLASLDDGSGDNLFILFFSAPLWPILGAIAGRTLKKKKGWT